jgi:hypothetical protein
MAGGEGERESSGVMFVVISIILLSGISIALIYLYTRVFKHIKSTNTSIMEIKSKIGSIVRDINFMHKVDFEVDVEQQKKIDQISKKLP